MSVLLLMVRAYALQGEFSDHRLYQFLPPVAGRAVDAVDMVQCEAEGESFQLPHFTPRGLRHLVQLDVLESLSPVLDMQVGKRRV
jgi:hypothetical protein